MAEFVSYNANPDGNRVGDCTIRAISAFLGKSWEETYIGIALTGFIMRDMPSADSVWGSYLRQISLIRVLRLSFSRCIVKLQGAQPYIT